MTLLQNSSFMLVLSLAAITEDGTGNVATNVITQPYSEVLTNDDCTICTGLFLNYRYNFQH